MTPTSVVRAFDVLLATPAPTFPSGSADAADGLDNGIAIAAIVVAALTAVFTLWVNHRVNKHERRLNSQRERLGTLLTVLRSVDENLTMVRRRLRSGGELPPPEGQALRYTEDLRDTAAILADRDLATRVELVSNHVFLFTQAWQAYAPDLERFNCASANFSRRTPGLSDDMTQYAKNAVGRAKADADVTRERLEGHLTSATPIVKEQREELERLIREL